MKQLWEAIDWVDEKYRYCREVLEGKEIWTQKEN